MDYFVYIVQCADASFYTGCTNDIRRRLVEHNRLKKGARYTKARRPVVLRYWERLGTNAKAKSRESAIKKLSRQEKLILIKNAHLEKNYDV